MAIRPVKGDVPVATLTAAGAGTTYGGPIAAAGAKAVFLGTHITATGGTPTLTVSLQESPNGVDTWTDVTGSAGAAITAVGNQVIMAVPVQSFIRAKMVVGGTTPSVTGTIAALVIKVA